MFGAAAASAAQAPPPAAGALRFDDVRLFHPAARLPRRVWRDTTRDDSRRTIQLIAADGTVLRGWFYPSPMSDAPFVVAFHGNNETIGDAWTQARDGFLYATLGFNLVTFDYRGTGFSDGAVSLAKARADALAIYDLATTKAAGRAVYVVGWSLGSIFASHVAASRPSVAGLVLLDPLAGADALPQDIARALHRPVAVAASVKQGIRNAEELRHYRGPLLVVHGTVDEVIPIAEGRADFAAAGATDKTFVPVAGKGHVQAIASVEADDAMAAFVARHAPAGTAGK
ncbi:MAG: alpha/beta fold hydrolase [Xanthomonadaceae bacterium]|nr:alpha/beta fold hydrolase [Xanthomonadaceae bacterium]MDE1963371.1 alpha/beta fold hydrolase [Xanthomonadaceae bacterium]